MIRHRRKTAWMLASPLKGPSCGMVTTHFKHAWCTPYTQEGCDCTSDWSLASHTGTHLAIQPFLFIPPVKQPSLRSQMLLAFLSPGIAVVLGQLSCLTLIFIISFQRQAAKKPSGAWRPPPPKLGNAHRTKNPWDLSNTLFLLLALSNCLKKSSIFIEHCSSFSISHFKHAF